MYVRSGMIEMRVSDKWDELSYKYSDSPGSCRIFARSEFYVGLI